MTTESKLRGGIALSLLCLIMMTFSYFEKDRVYSETRIQLNHTQDSLSTQKIFSDSLLYIVQEKVHPKEHFDGVTEMILENYIDEEFLNDKEVKEHFKGKVTIYSHEQRIKIVDELKKLNKIHLDWYTTLEVYRVTNPISVEEIERIKNHYTE
jgi:hypothetical protein